MMNDPQPLKVKTTLCFTPGAGGHFLLGASGFGWCDISRVLNEYKSKIPWLELEDAVIMQAMHVIKQGDTYTQSMLLSSIDAHKDMAISWRDRFADEFPHSDGIVAGHWLPLVTSRLMDFHTEELVISSDPADLEHFIAALAFIKTFFTDDWSRYPGKVNQIFEHTVALMIDRAPHSHSQLQMPGDFIWDMEQISNGFREMGVTERVRIAHTLIGWLFFLSCARTGHRAGDIQRFVRFVNDRYDAFLNQQRVMNPLFSDVSPEIYGRLVQLRYADTFFDLQRPASDVFARLDMLEVANYSHRNIQLLRGMSGLFRDAIRTALLHSIDDAEQRLSMAVGAPGETRTPTT